jgi:hypothetical protein
MTVAILTCKIKPQTGCLPLTTFKSSNATDLKNG